TAVEDATRRDDRDTATHGVDDLRHQRECGDGTGVAAGLRSLRDHDVAAGLDRPPRVVDLAAHVDDDHAVAMTQVVDVERHAEGGDEHAGAAGDDLLDLPDEIARHRGQEVDAPRLVG